MQTKTRTRDEILSDLADYRRKAGRMTVKDPRYEATHLVINGLLTELEWLEA